MNFDGWKWTEKMKIHWRSMDEDNSITKNKYVDEHCGISSNGWSDCNHMGKNTLQSKKDNWEFIPKVHNFCILNQN